MLMTPIYISIQITSLNSRFISPTVYLISPTRLSTKYCISNFISFSKSVPPLVEEVMNQHLPIAQAENLGLILNFSLSLTSNSLKNIQNLIFSHQPQLYHLGPSHHYISSELQQQLTNWYVLLLLATINSLQNSQVIF